MVSGVQLTWDLHLHERQDLEDEDGDPAERVSDDDGEEALGDSQLLFDVVAVFGGLRACSLYVVEHAAIREDDDEECC